jgi:2-keto-4-pentenoate hydratase
LAAEAISVSMVGMSTDKPAWRAARDGARGPVTDVADEAAARLARAAATGIPCAPVRDLIGADDVPRAYRVQGLLVTGWLAAGTRRVGRKIGLTAPAVQAQLGVGQPDFGVLLSSMRVGQDEPVASSRLLQPRIEAEVAFVLGRDIAGTDPGIDEVASAVATARPALEIVDSRIVGWDITIADTVADNASCGLFVLGDAEVPLGAFDPVAVSMTLQQDGEEVSSGTGAACLGNPLNALAWLAATAAAYGDPLRAGEIVLSGALGPMVPVRAGARYEASLSGLGKVRAAFAPDDACLGLGAVSGRERR